LAICARNVLRRKGTDGARRLAPQRPLPRLRGRVREGACTRRRSKLTLSPPLSRKREREQTEFAALLCIMRQTLDHAAGAWHFVTS